jgi:hypothetical protein
MLRTIAATATTIGALALSTTASQAGEVIRDHPVVHGVVAKATGRACAEEDSVNCFWNDGSGHALYSIRVGHKVCRIYWNEKFNRHHGYCFRP